jgi:pyruvate kinase
VEGIDVAVVADLQGEKNRFAKIGDVDSIPVRVNQPIVIGDVRPSIDADVLHLPVQFAELLANLSVGDVLVEGDGAILLKVLETDPERSRLTCVADTDGVIHPGRGFVAQSQTFHPRPLTEKDVADAEFTARHSEFDAVALSFVRSGTDIQHLRKIVPNRPLIAKVETPLGISNVVEIAESSDMVMAARGDLALTMPWVRLPAAMQTLAKAAEDTRTPWILATQIAEGLERFAFPTRAEICDLARWVTTGAHGAMLSYETAFGSRPAHAVAAVAQVLREYQNDHGRGSERLPVL